MRPRSERKIEPSAPSKNHEGAATRKFKPKGCATRRHISVLTYGVTYWIVTFTTVVTVVVPDVPVTLIAAAPFGVPGEPPLELEEEDAEQPTITKASVNIAKPMPNARCRRGACRNLTIPVTRNADSMTVSPMTPNGQGPLRGSVGSVVEAAIVESIN
jgi:hypothetical protein